MGKKPISKMAVSERAKQFMPFKAVLGLDEALERKRIELGVQEPGQPGVKEHLSQNEGFADI